jgi:hypothetical protein
MGIKDLVKYGTREANILVRIYFICSLVWLAFMWFYFDGVMLLYGRGMVTPGVFVYLFVVIALLGLVPLIPFLLLYTIKKPQPVKGDDGGPPTGIKKYLAKEIDYKWGAVLLSIVLILLVLPFKNAAGQPQGYGVAWAFAGALRYVDEYILNIVLPGHTTGHPFYAMMGAPVKVLVTLVCFVLGGFIGARISGEFSINFDKTAVTDGVIGGLLMGIGMAMMSQCNVGVFMGAVSQMALGGYLCVIGLIIGTYIGSMYYKKKMGL